MVSQGKTLSERVTRLESELDDLKQWAAALIVPVTSLDPEPYVLTRPITVVIQPDDDSFVATYFDGNINASGDTQQDAVVNLKDMLIALFERLSKEPKKNLGKGPARQRAVLQGLILRKHVHAAH